VTDGDILFRGESVLDMQPDERARAGIFLAFQYPVEIPGVSVANFMRTALERPARRRGGRVRLPGRAGGAHGHAGDGPHLRAALGERRVLGRREWDELPDDIKNTYDKLGIPEAEKQVPRRRRRAVRVRGRLPQAPEDLEEQGVIFLDMDTALREHEELVKQYFGTIIPVRRQQVRRAEHGVWSGGSFIYVPPGVKVDMPLQAYFRINAENMGQFERTLIIVDEGAYVHYVEGCTAPIYSSDSLHSAVVEIIVKKGARCRYTTIQNWSNNVYNLVTKRAVARPGATMEWVDGNIGSKLTMKYPAVYLMGEHANGEVLSIAFAGEGQHQDAGAKMVHARRTRRRRSRRSRSRGRRPHVVPRPAPGRRGRHGSKSNVVCDALILDDQRAPTPTRTSRSRGRRRRSATRRRSRRSATSSSST
jgi:FeS assembly protein SufB